MIKVMTWEKSGSMEAERCRKRAPPLHGEGIPLLQSADVFSAVVTDLAKDLILPLGPGALL